VSTPVHSATPATPALPVESLPVAAFGRELAAVEPGPSGERKSDALCAAGPPEGEVVWPLQPHISRWPDHLVEQVLRYLPLADLMRCRCVCRSWYRVGGPRVQARALMRGYSASHRQQLYQALAADRGRRLLTGWGGRPSPDAVSGRDRSSHRDEGLSGGIAFFELVRQMVTTKQFAVLDEQNLCGRHWGCSGATFSPDAQWFASTYRDQNGDAPRQNCVDLWWCGASRLQLVSRNEYPLSHEPGRRDSVEHLMFSADSRRLRVIERRGWQRVWQWQPGQDAGCWENLGSLRLCANPVTVVASSGNAGYLAVVSGESLFVYEETGTAHWRQQWEWPWWESCRRCPQHRAGAPVITRLALSHDGQHLVMQGPDELFLAHRSGEVWQEQYLKDEQGQQQEYRWCEDATLESGGSLLAVTASLHKERFAAVSQVEGQFTLYRFAPGPGWLRVTCRRCNRYGRGLSATADFSTYYTSKGTRVAFSPDARQLAFADQENEKGVRLCLLSVDSQPPWADPVFMPVICAPVPHGGRGASLMHAPIWQLVSVSFSPDGHFLAACSTAYVAGCASIWKRVSMRGWVKVVMEEYEGWYYPPITFAPDGLHCALVQKVGIDILGPGPDGRYIKKMKNCPASRFVALLFSPDFSRLLGVTLNSLMSWRLGPALARGQEKSGAQP